MCLIVGVRTEDKCAFFVALFFALLKISLLVKSGRFVDYEHFHDAIFQLADTWVDGLAVDDCLTYLHRLLDAVAVVQVDAGGGKEDDDRWELRPESEVCLDPWFSREDKSDDDNDDSGGRGGGGRLGIESPNNFADRLAQMPWLDKGQKKPLLFL